MTPQQQAAFTANRDAAVALRHPDGRPMRRHIVALADCVQAFVLSLEKEGIEGQTLNIAMNEPMDYADAAAYVAKQMNIEVLDLVDQVGQDFAIDISKARYVLGYRPQFDIYRLIDEALQFRRAGRTRRQRSGYKG